MSIPQAYICPITLTLMTDPYSDKDGNTYEKEAIFKWIAEHGNSPITRNPMSTNDLRPNRALKDAIDEYNGITVAPSNNNINNINTSLGRDPINIIMIADTSGSMNETCDITNVTEKLNLTRLDLVKHTMKTVIESLAPTDNLALISFSYNAKILSSFRPVKDKSNKSNLNDKINSLYPDGGTNIWDALRVAIDVASNTKLTDKINILLFTDGVSNSDPPRGIINTLKDYLNNKPHLNIILNTYGFGNDINSKLLYDITRTNISELNTGIFGFIPDATMIGTVFINSIAYMMDNKTIELSSMEQEIVDKFINLISQKNLSGFVDIISNNLYSDFLRDLNMDCSYFDNDNDGQIEKALRPNYYNTWGKHYILSVLSAYKNKLCLNFKDKGVQHFKTPEFEVYQKLIEEVFINLPPPTPSGSIYNNMGSYGVPLGANIAPISSQQFTQNFYNASSTVCILENTLVRVFEDHKEQYIPVQNIKKGTCLLTNNTSTFVRCVIKTKHNGPICITKGKDINNCVGITPYHPIKYNNDYNNDNWVFPINSNHFELVNMENVYVYNFFLEGIHEIELKYNIIAITLNHGKSGPVISHNYFGTNRVENDFQKHPDWENGFIEIDDIKAIRDPNTNEVISLEY